MQEDLLEFILALPSLEGYTPQDRYYDFVQVFHGSDQGRRVLKEILSWGGMFRAPPMKSPIDPYASHVHIGARNMALRLLATVAIEPPQQPEQARKHAKPTG